MDLSSERPSFDSIVDKTAIFYFIADSIIASRPIELDALTKHQSSQHSSKSTLFRLAKTLFELLHCLCSPSVFARAIGRLPQSLLS